MTVQAMFRAFAPPSSTSAVKSATGPRSRPKRTQVTRACDWCRVHRIKCDNHHPCSTCKSRGGPCTMTGVTKQATLPHVYREVERLRLRVQELESESAAGSSGGSNSNSGSSSSTEAGSDPRPVAKRFREGIHIRTARSPHKTWYGAASLFHFIGRIDALLSPESPGTASHMLPNSASMLLDGPMPIPSIPASTTPIDPGSVQAGDFLTATQEEYFLGLFWQSYYTSCPILDEIQFKEHYQSLWATTSRGYERKPSALVDIVLAVCMQYGMALPGSGRRDSTVSSSSSSASRADVTNNDATIAGRWHYQRCQTLLASELETPTMSTLQCHILSSMYLSCSSFENMADSTCSMAVRTAYMLGLHLEPSDSMPYQEREMRRRLWWTLYVLETKMSMKLGRPFLLHESSTTCSLPAADRDIAMLAGSSFAPLGGDVTWLTWNLENTKLILAVRATYTAFYDKVPSTMNACDGHWDDVQTLGPVADVLDAHTKRLDHWLTNLPDALKTKRENNGTPFSTDRSALEIEPFAPLWLQRQRLLLELMYHNLCTNLYRPFIPFAPTTAPSASPQADPTAMKCAAHAMTLTHILHQVLSSTSILTGWHEAFQWQWSAAITLVGFVLAYPQSDLTREARNTIGLSVAVFESFGDSFAVAASAADSMRDLSAKVDLRTEQSQEKQIVVAQDFKKLPDEMQIQLQLDTVCKEPVDQSFIYGDFTTMEMADRPLCFDSEDTADIQRMLFQTTDMDFSINSYSNLEMLWSSMNYS